MFKKIGKLERKKIMTWILMWLNWSVVILNTTLQLLDIYRYRFTLKKKSKITSTHTFLMQIAFSKFD